MQYLFNSDGVCVIQSTYPVDSTGYQECLLDELYDIDTIRMVNGEVVFVEKQLNPSVALSEFLGDIPVYRVAHGDSIPSIQPNAIVEIIGMQLSGDNFNSPNIGKEITAPTNPFYNGIDFTAGINDKNQAYVSNNKQNLEERITGWLTIKIKQS